MLPVSWLDRVQGPRMLWNRAGSGASDSGGVRQLGGMASSCEQSRGLSVVDWESKTKICERRVVRAEAESL
jgi:hypothetical protein